MTENLSAIAKIYNKRGYIEGTGFLVLSSYVLTCAHVIEKALKLEDKTEIPQETVKIDFLQCTNLRAKVVFWQPCYSSAIGGARWGEDIAVLKIIEDLSSDMRPIKLELSEVKEEDIKIFGFPENYDMGVWASSKICGSAFNGWIQMDQITLNDRIIEGGFSGAPVWNKDKTIVMGMAVASDLGKQENRKATAFAIPCSILVNNGLKFVRLGDILENLVSSSLINLLTIENAYFSSRRPGLEKAIPLDIQAMVKDFADEARLKLDKSKRSLDLEQFVVELLKKTGGDKNPSFDDLRQWGQNYVEDFERLLQQTNEIQEIESKKKEVNGFLMLRFIKNKQSQDYYISALLLIDNNQDKVLEEALSYTLEVNINNKPSELQEENEFSVEDVYKFMPSICEDLLEQINRIKIEYNYQFANQLEILFFLPYALLNEYLETIEIEDDDELPIALRAEYQVVFRSEKRLQAKYNHWEKWKKNWNQVQQLCHESCQNSFESDENCGNWKVMFSQLEKKAIGCVLTKKPSQEMLKVFDRTGLAIAVWSKQILEAPDYQEQLNNVLGSSIIDLPKLIKDKHLEAFAENDPEQHIGHHLTLVWENPYLVPPSLEYSNP